MNPAEFAKLSYEMNKTENREQRINNINKKLEGSGYGIDASKSGKNTSYFINPNTKHIVIADRGSSFNTKKGKFDLASDLLYTIGLEKHAPQFQKRANKINSLVKNAPDDHKITLTGHSYAGGTIHNTLLHKPQVLKRIDEAHLFNPLISPFSKNASKAQIKELDNKLVVHRTQNDIPSYFYHNLPYGKVNVYKQKQHAIKNLPKHLEGIFDTAEQLKAHSIQNFIDE